MIKAIFAVDYWGGMGNNGTIPWPHHREDFQYFRRQTEGHVVVMGRRTWDDPKMPKPLPNRINYVVTNRPITGMGVTSINGDIKEHVKRIAQLYPTKTVWIIGGPKIILECKDLLDEVCISHIKGQYRTDTKIDLRKFLMMFRVTSASPSMDGQCSWMTYKNIDIFRQ